MHVHLLVAWLLILTGLAAGALIGLRFHEEGWLGGYASWRRRLLRLGHIAFFGTGLLNLAFGLTLSALGGQALPVPSTFLIAGSVAMPLCCFLAAWRQQFRHLFALPVLGLIAGVAGLLVQGFLLGKVY